MDNIRVPFDSAEFEAISRRAERNLRTVPNEIRFIVREALYADGRLKRPDPPASAPYPVKETA